MLPTVEEALQELRIAETMNPGPWVKHSIHTGEAAKRIAERIPGMDANKACVVGLLHDIGRRVGVVNTPRHVWEGYNYCMKKGWDEAARVCMTHSYVFMREESVGTGDTEAERGIRAFLRQCGPAEDEDRLIQLCDSLATDYGFVILEKRFVDVTRRYGIVEDYIRSWDVLFQIMEEFEKRMGCAVYEVLPDIEKTTLLNPKPWIPSKK